MELFPFAPAATGTFPGRALTDETAPIGSGAQPKPFPGRLVP